MTRPVAASLKTLILGIGNADEAISAYINAGSQNAALRREVDTNRTKLIEADAIRQENERLKRLLRLTEVETDVVGTAPSHQLDLRQRRAHRPASISARHAASWPACRCARPRA